MPAAAIFSLKASNDPKVAVMASPSFPEAVPPALGARLSQKKVWFQCPPPLLRTGAPMLPAMATISASVFPSLGVPARALFKLST